MTPRGQDSVPARFDRAVPTYDEHAHVQREMAAWLAEWLPPERAGDALEIAAGTGIFTGRLLPWNGRLIATDFSPAMVAAGRERYPQVSWEVREAGELTGERYDWILSCSFLQWSGSPERLLGAWRRQLRPGGRVLSGFFVDGALPALHAMLGDLAPLPARSAEEWTAHFRRAGFRVRDIQCRDHVRDHASALELFRDLHRIGATGKPRLGAPRLRRLLDAYERACRRPDGRIEAVWRYCRLLAER